MSPNDLLQLFEEKIQSALAVLRFVVKEHHPILVCGNGGSAADAEHIVAELVGAFLHRDRPPVNAISLVSNAALVTAIANDYSYDDVFSRQVWAHCSDGAGALIAISTSGRSKNVLSAMSLANELGMPVILFTREDPTRELPIVPSVVFDIPFATTAEVQQAHQVIYHRLCQLLEELVL